MKLFLFLFLIIFIMISIVFLTLLEQKILSYIQIRKGPNKSGMLGLLQPFCDAVKLFSKELILPVYSIFFLYYLCPVFSFMVTLFIWLVFPFFFNLFSFDLMFMFMFSCMSIGVYFIMFSGWSSNSNYSLLGSLRSIAQTISYEVSMILFFFCYFILVFSLNLKKFIVYQEYFSFIFLNLLISFILFVIFLAETNRSPFDFAEGESELVSGFNVEYGSVGFSLIFLAEYSMILFLCMIFSFMFFFNSLIYIIFFFKMIFLSFIFIWVRGSFPRYRYDKLMYLSWKIYLPISLFFLMMFLSFKIMFFVFKTNSFDLS